MQNRQSFESAARRVSGRLALARWTTLLARTAMPLFLVLAVLAVLGFWLESGAVNLIAGIVVVLGWLIASAVVSWVTRPTAVAAMCAWDSRTGRKDMFTSALCFEGESSRTVGQELHLQKAGRTLDSEIPNLPRHIPVPFSQRSWIFPLSFLAVVFALSLFAPEPVQAAVVDEDDKHRAKDIANELEQTKDDLDDKKGLDEEEKKKIEKLKNELKETAEKLKKLDKESKKDVLAELEKRAKEAEALAAELAGKNDQLSSEMLKELAKHIDTAELAGALMAKDMKATASEAQKIEKKLDSKNLTKEEQNRIGKALDSAMKKANTQDKKSLLGKNIQAADKNLKADQPKPAAKEFKKIADRAKKAAQRQKTQQQLKQLAKQLRKSGQKIFGQNGLKKVGNAQKGTNLKNLANLPMGKLPMGRNQQAAPNNQPLPNGPLQPPNPNAPVSTNAPPPGANQPPTPGQKPGQAGKPSNAPPVPGACKNGQCKGGKPGAKPGSKAGQCAGGNCPVPGTKPGNGAKKGGLKAGVGSANPFAGITNPFKATGTETVNAQINKDGQTQVKNIEPRPHQENTRKTKAQIAAEVTRAEENALADELLPQSRQQQVKRYFQALRASLEKE